MTTERAWTPVEHLQALAEGCQIHGVGFICRHTWDDLEGPAFDGGSHEYAQALNAARARLAAAALKVVEEPRT